MDWPETIGVGTFTAFIGAAFAYGVQRIMAARMVRNSEATSRTEEILSLRRAITELQLDNALLKKDVLPLSQAVQQWAVEKLTHNHTPEMDELLTRVNTLSDAEMKRLDELLQERVVEYDDIRIDAIERLAAAMLLPIISWVKETEKITKIYSETLHMVSTPNTEEKQEDEKKKKKKKRDTSFDNDI